MQQRVDVLQELDCVRRIVNQFIGCGIDLEISIRSRSPSRTTNSYATNTTI